ncbi:MAG: hypothetical protein ACYC8T_18375 [Myxococcaceae bacterium]
MTRPTPFERGQTLVLFALTLMLLTLMVCMTLSFGTKAKEKVELQIVADQAAFSNAVVEARAFNSIAMLTRAQFAHMVALLGVESAISYASAYRGYLDMLFIDYILEMAFSQAPRCNPPGQWCGCIGVPAVLFGRMVPLWRELSRVRAMWEALDTAAALQARANQSAASTLYLAEVDAFGRELVWNSLKDAKLTQKVTNQAKAGRAEWTVPSGPGSLFSGVTARESGWIPFQGAALINNWITKHEVIAAMGTRGHWFTTARMLMPQLPINNKFRQVLGASEAVVAFHTGSSYYGPSLHANSRSASDGTFAWADDHGLGTVRYAGPGCPGIPWFLFSFAWVKSTDLDETMDQHEWFPKFDGDPQPAERTHTLGPCYGPNCLGVWINQIDYNFIKVVQPGDIFGQPKNYTVVQRDYSARNSSADPWNLFFNFRFTSTGPGTKLDLRSGTGGQGSGLVLRDGTNISKQTALSAGVAYYHRKGHWKEPPNFFNPFWRAGLVRADIDDDGRDPNKDIPDTLNSSGVPWAADAYRQLYANGFRGVQ